MEDEHRTMKKMKILIFILTTTIIINNTFSQSIWLENSFEDFRDGSFLDAGSNSYVSAKGRIQMITRWDFNNDGNLDLFIPAGQSHTEKENIYIYLNDGADLNGRSRIELPAAGAIDGLLADFNKDGYDDLAVIHYSDSYFKRIPVWIYLGSENGYSIDNRVELPSAWGSAIAAGDFNNDSWIDIAIASQYYQYSEDINEESRKSFIYWNSENGLDPKNNFPITFNKRGVVQLAVGDIDNDGINDLTAMNYDSTYLFLSSRNAFSNIHNVIPINIKANAASIGNVDDDGRSDVAFSTSKGIKIVKSIYNGRVNLSNSVLLPVSKSSDVVLIDLNKDNLDDVVTANFSTTGGATWTDSPVFYSDGKDFTQKGTTKLPTLGAKAVTSADLNGDEYPEIIFSFFQITNQKNLLSYIYWNDKGKFTFQNHSQLPTLGTMANAVGDVNNDDIPDVVFFNDEGFFRDGPMESPIYWGDGSRSFDENRKFVFQTHQVFGFGHADLDDDDNVDMILCQKNFVSGVQHDQGGLIIHWRENGEFGPPTHLTMKWGYGGVRVADINKDGYLDLLAGGTCIDIDNPGRHGFPIFWGSENGYSFRKRTVLHLTASSMRVPLLMDLNKDGWLDIAGQDEYGKVKFWWGSSNNFSNENTSELDLGRHDRSMYLKGADFNKDGWLDLVVPQRIAKFGEDPTSFIYYGSAEGFSNNNRTEVYSFVPYQNSIADINKDGWLDLFLTSYGCEVDSNRPSVIHWGSENGFKEKYTDIESYGSSGSEVLDYDSDGWLDLLICNHRKADSYLVPKPHLHQNPSLLYWGSPEGYSKENRWEVMATGPSGLNPRDAGNSYDRGLYEDYISSVYEVKTNEVPSAINWEAETPFGTDVQFQIRVFNKIEEIESTSWIGANGEDSWFHKSGSALENIEGNFIQYRARLITPNGAGTPYLTSVSISFEKK
jgi:hypothetical protein